MIGRCGYELVATVPMFRRVLRAGYRWKDPGPGPIGRVLRAARDAASLLATRAPPPPIRIGLRPVEAFGPEIEPILAAYEGLAVSTSRGPDSLNHLLRYPRGGPDRLARPAGRPPPRGSPCSPSCPDRAGSSSVGSSS